MVEKGKLIVMEILMFFIMYHVRICYRPLKRCSFSRRCTKTWVGEGIDLVYSDRSLEGDIYYNLEGEVSGAEDCRIQGPEGEGMGSHWDQHWELKL